MSIIPIVKLTTQAKFYKKGANGFVEETGFKADKSYIFTSEDYADIAGADENKGFVGSDEEVEALNFAILAEEICCF